MTTGSRTLGEAINTVSALLFKAGIANARSEARLIVQHVIETSGSVITRFPHEELRYDVRNKIWPLAERRAQHEPVPRSSILSFARVLGVESKMASMSVSLSGLGIRVSFETLKARLQNSFSLII